MAEYEIFGIPAEIDGTRTKNWYAHSSQWNCTCGHCRHFVALARERALPAPILEVLDRLQIPPEKATYVCQMLPTEKGDLYQFSYRIAGTVPEDTPSNKQEWGEVRCCHEPYPYGAPDFPQPHFDLEFWVDLPPLPQENA